ncbi:MAG TPA: 30S ribosomal protein S17 [Candidatus Paceibacterota bacterium]|nr:30S ribosomal protein S17 [Candidatus Paceibacterota bacterium]
MTKKDIQNNKVEKINKGKVLSGVISSTKMTDTITVTVNRYHKHPKYGKYINSRKRYKAHDAGNTAKLGDKVEIIETKPISKDKRFKLLRVVIPAKIADESVTDNK